MKSQIHESNTTRIAVLENTAIHTNETLKRLEDKIEKGFYESRKESMSQFRWIMGTIGVGFIMPTILKLLHWV